MRETCRRGSSEGTSSCRRLARALHPGGGPEILLEQSHLPEEIPLAQFRQADLLSFLFQDNPDLPGLDDVHAVAYLPLANVDLSGPVDFSQSSRFQTNRGRERKCLGEFYGRDQSCPALSLMFRIGPFSSDRKRTALVPSSPSLPNKPSAGSPPPESLKFDRSR
jgi:hypothetical protein